MLVIKVMSRNIFKVYYKVYEELIGRKGREVVKISQNCPAIRVVLQVRYHRFYAHNVSLTDSKIVSHKSQ